MSEQTLELGIAMRILFGAFVGMVPLFRGAKNKKLIVGIIGIFATVIVAAYFGSIWGAVAAAVFVALTGKEDESEVFDPDRENDALTRYTELIFFCKSCGGTFSLQFDPGTDPLCPCCKQALRRTRVPVEEWRSYTEEQKNEMRAAFARGNPRPVVDTISEKPQEYETPYTPVTSVDAEELKKCKELLDMGVLTQEEFEEKKRAFLGR